MSGVAGHPTQPDGIYPWDSSSRSPVDVLLSANGDGRRGPMVWLVAGAAAAVFGLGWVGGANWHRLSDLVVVADPPTQKVTYSRRVPEAETRSARTDGPVRKPAPATAPQGTPLAAAVSRAVPAVPANINLATASIPPRETMAPAAETRPMTIEGWTVREVRGATAILEGPDGVWTVARGDTVPAVGRIDSIVRWGSRWIVATDSGLIATP
ncbi:hypothetical protein [Bradyrhizobium sp.]|uniref:hypothetical protein n=1 Tax=Bradyrhizobium sp. TaxID=376 RepID=UPI0025BD9C9F|nr:hypothetical protein [Bradyrhizobium sp.]